MFGGDYFSLTNPLSALVAGLVTSLHCVGMCGPLACTVLKAKPGSSVGAAWTHLSYHFARLFSYAMIGGLAGSFGAGFVNWVGATPAKIVPIAMALFFLAMVLGWEGIAARVRFLNRYTQRLMRWAYSISGWKRGIALGVATPLLPCGPLYLLFWVAAISGSFGGGVVVLLAFGLGTVPALMASQLGFDWLSKSVGPAKLKHWKRGLAFVAMSLVLLRFSMDVDLASLASGEAFCN